MLSGLLNSAERAIKRLEFAYLQPLQFAVRKRRRLASFAIESVDRLPWLDGDLWPRSDDCTADCGKLIKFERGYYANYLAGGEGAAGGRLWRGTPCAIDLDLYPDFARYADRVRGHSKRRVLRQ